MQQESSLILIFRLNLPDLSLFLPSTLSKGGGGGGGSVDSPTNS